MVDPLVAHIPMEIDSHKDQSVRRALAPLCRLADEHGCAVLSVMHLNKAQGLAPLARLSGSGAFGNLARSVLLLDRDPDDPDAEEGNRRVLAHVKSNISALAASLLYEIEPILLSAEDDQPEVETSRLRLLGESPHNGYALLSVASEEERGALEEAEDFLRGELGDDETRYPAEELFKAARKIGIKDRTLQRARKGIGAKTEKAGFGRGWEWWLPKAPSQPSKPALLHEETSHQVLAPSEESSPLAPSENGRIPIPGDPGFPDWIDQKCHDRWITEAEWVELRKLHVSVIP